MCGIYSILNYKGHNIYKKLINGLFHLQHRGQESSGITIFNKNNVFKTFKSNGLLKNLIKKMDQETEGYIGFGHLRYSTNPDKSENCIQPYCSENIMLCYNGNIYNTKYIYGYLENNEIKCKYKVESYLFFKLIELLSKDIHKTSDIEIFIKKINNICRGAYSVILYIKNIGLISFKDYHGIKPLLYGRDKNNFSISSESISFEKNDIKEYKDLYNNEYIYINVFNKENIIKYDNPRPYTPCIFEYIYISRIDSILNNIPIYKSRYNMGIYLAMKIKKSIKYKFDYIIPIPDTSKPFASGVSDYLNVPYKEFIIKNRYVNRTFIMNSQNERNKKLELKFSIIKSLIKGKNILIIDDSIVRGNTIKHISKLFKNEEVKNICIASCSPEIYYPNRYGIDINDKNELLMNKISKEDLLEYLNIDNIIFQDINDLVKAVRELNLDLKEFDLSIFNGKYIS